MNKFIKRIDFISYTVKYHTERRACTSTKGAFPACNINKILLNLTITHFCRHVDGYFVHTKVLCVHIANRISGNIVHTLLQYIRGINAGASFLEGAVSSACFLSHSAVILTI